MTKPDFFRRTFLGCFTATSTSITTTSTPITSTITSTTKKRLSTSLRDDIITDSQDSPSCSSPSSTNSDNISIISKSAPPRSSKSMVICTFFGHRGGSHVWFCLQINRNSSKPSLLLEFSLSTRNLIKEMHCGLLRIALECSSIEFSSCPLHLVPLWTLFCNGRRVGFATRRKATKETRDVLEKMHNITMGAGVIVGRTDTELRENKEEERREELIYMRANYEWVIGGADSESFHLISPNECSGQELSVFLLRSASIN